MSLQAPHRIQRRANKLVSYVMSVAEGIRRPWPWRETTDPYTILVTEILLQRTLARKVANVYDDFFGIYPYISNLSKANVLEMEEMLRPLGLQGRVRRLIAVAESIMARHAGAVPTQSSELIHLAGVGPYTAAAVRCFAFGYPEAAVDANVVRVFSRYLYGTEHADAKVVSEVARTALEAAMGAHDPRAVNWGVLDFAALICRPRFPRCTNCGAAPECHWALIATNQTG